jgi:hypothetical protein
MVTSKVQLADFVDKLFWDIFARIAANPLILFYPNFFLYQITETDKRFYTNCTAMRAFLQNIIDERKKKTLDDDEDVDMISLLV